MELIQTYQLDMMLFMAGMCFVLAIMTLMPDFMSPRRRRILALMELSCTLLLLCDRASYLNRGDATEFGGYAVRFSNGMAFFFTILIPLLVTYFLRDLYVTEGQLERPPRLLWACEVLFVIGTILIVITQFNGLYYTFDEHNVYHRAPGILISYMLSFLIVIVQECTIIRYRALLGKRLVRSLMAYPVLGHQILSSIRQSPYLSIGARYHHERYDGRGYPDGLAAEQIPEIARIIAVADAYDAMTSSRSYRGALIDDKVRNEIVEEMGSQFDERFATILLQLIDSNEV